VRGTVRSPDYEQREGLRISSPGERTRGILLYYEQSLRDSDPERLARTVDEVFQQYGSNETENELVDLDEWYDWLHG